MNYEKIEKNGLYDYIANEGHTLSKDDLITLVKELDYKLYNICEQSDFNYKKNINSILKLIKNYEED